jgi:hypothetical protein
VLLPAERFQSADHRCRHDCQADGDDPHQAASASIAITPDAVRSQEEKSSIFAFDGELICHILATDQNGLVRTMADFCGLRRTPILWQFPKKHEIP